ncbi:hypothetical protein PQX77_006052 [Marasmius sp. AFHP31]|nr:hypothetical protein PQX77_006052 [Marasmius sp. AFHP31]
MSTGKPDKQAEEPPRPPSSRAARASSSSITTENAGDHNQTYNHSTAGVDSDSREASSSIVTPGNSSSSQSVASTSQIGSGSSMRGKRYVSLLSATGPGYPLWKPSPRRTDTGEEHAIKIGDVGICSDIDPFLTLFNITEPLGRIINGDRAPDGVLPHYNIQGKVTVDNDYHHKPSSFTAPQGSISHSARTDGDNSTVFTFSLSEKEGALLMLPQGGILRKLGQTGEFRRRIKRYWREWYDFADKEGYLDEGQTLCLLTGVEQCATWAIAVWEPVPSESSYNSDPLVLTVDGTRDKCSWGSFSSRCSTQSTPTLPEGAMQIGLKETVFVRALWFTRKNGRIMTEPPQPPVDQDDEGDDRPEHRGRSTSDSFDSPQSPTSGPPAPDPPNNSRDHPGRPESHSTSSTRECPGENYIVDLPTACDSVFHPCQLINSLAFEIISKAKPSLFDSGCAAFAHDEDWISVLEDFNGQPPNPGGNEFLRRICMKFKFVAEGDIIYTENMTTPELELIQQSTSSVRNDVFFPVLFHLQDPGLTQYFTQVASSAELQLPDNEAMSMVSAGRAEDSSGLMRHDAGFGPVLQQPSTTRPFEATSPSRTLHSAPRVVFSSSSFPSTSSVLPSSVYLSMAGVDPRPFNPHYVEHSGRIYSSYSGAIYPLPSDPEESERLNKQHEILKELLPGNYVGPIHDVLTPGRDRQLIVVDIGTGMGQWCIEMAERFPHVEFYGLDIAPIAPRTNIPPNVHFQLHDINQPTPFQDRTVDVVHARGVTDYQTIIQEAARILVRGGMFHSGEWGRYASFHPDIDGVSPAHDVPNFHRFYEVLNQTLLQCRGIPSVSRSIPQMIDQSGGFGDVTTRPFYVPIGGWQGDEGLKRIGKDFRQCVKRYMEACRRVLLESGYLNTDIDALINHAYNDIRNTPGLVSIYHTVYSPRL